MTIVVREAEILRVCGQGMPGDLPENLSETLRLAVIATRNPEREWQILERYQRSLGNLMDWLCGLDVMGLSLHNLQ